MKRKTEIIFEEKQVLFVSRIRTVSPRERCPVCAEPRRLVTPEEAALLTRSNIRAVYRWIEAGDVHYVQRGDGSIGVCLASLPSPGVVD